MLVGNGSGGCCDCGDPEAFNHGAPRCGVHVISSPDRESSPLPVEVRDAIKQTMETALDFVIDVFSTAPMSKNEINAETCDKFAEWSELNYESVAEKDKEDGRWVVILYNDEGHSYHDVTSQLYRIDNKRYDKEGALQAAHRIDTVGREAILKTFDQATAIKTAQSIMKIGLFCSVRTERDFARECLAGTILHWLMDCISIGVAVGGDEMILREVMCQVLAGQWRMGIKSSDPRIEIDDPYSLLSDTFPSNSSPGPYAADWSTQLPTTGPAEERWIVHEYIRLDWILFFDARLWKTLRKCVKSIILGCLLGGKAEVAGTAIDHWGPRNWKRITGNRLRNDLL
jgi:hypothetical protein